MEDRVQSHAMSDVSERRDPEDEPFDLFRLNGTEQQTGRRGSEEPLHV